MKNVVKGSFMSGKKDIKLDALKIKLVTLKRRLASIKNQKNTRTLRKETRRIRVALLKQHKENETIRYTAYLGPKASKAQLRSFIKKAAPFESIKSKYTSKKRRKSIVIVMKKIKAEITNTKKEISQYK